MAQKRYSELIKFPSFKSRFDYLSLDGSVGYATFGSHRYLNQMLYQSEKWKHVRREVILRDNGCDLAHEEYPIGGSIYVHHINPISIDDILEERDCAFDFDNLVCVSFRTHNELHYGSKDLFSEFSTNMTRIRNDTCPWKI